MFFLPYSKLIVLEDPWVSGEYAYSRWSDWLLSSTDGEPNTRFPQAMTARGGFNTVPGQLAPLYYFTMNGWKIRPMSSDHTVRAEGLLYNEDGLSPFSSPPGYNVSIERILPEVALGYNISGSSLTAQEIVSAMIAAGITRKNDLKMFL